MVTYPDGSSEVVVVHVEVKNADGSNTQATNATIATQVQEVSFGTSVNDIDPEKSIDQANSTGLDKRDTSTPIEWKVTPDTSPEFAPDEKSKDVTAVMSVKFQDGSWKEVPVTIRIIKQDNSLYNPQGAK
ncbi:hypothetical protein GTO87_02130 [Ligilactobacillus saerimneri]|uniref:Rib domain-containing protein n=1 Tax=Ligilactobacillus saerimneri TaxID=228229 RepID=A0A7H9EJU8_9LACO|nr:Rib/alpha-like domain-containing protein [Ligilactobacillus saerimneri]QLL77522.1 hypothetical protein GTO87_02130 [Ligilactobacillus saerimneri]